MARISQPDLHEFANATLRRSGLAAEDAEATAGGLVEATFRGVSSHGVFRLPHYAESLRAGAINPRPNVSVLHGRGATVVVDADGGYGYRPSIAAMEIAIGIAQEQGVGLAGVRNSHHFGAAATYTLQAAHQQIIGLATTTTSPRIAPTGGVSPVIGNNPLSIAVPRRPPLQPIVLDMPLGQVALGKIRIAAAAGSPVPEGWGFDSAGRPAAQVVARVIVFTGIRRPPLARIDL